MRTMITKIIKCLCFYVFIATCIADYVSADTSLESKTLKLISDAVFEVVVPKPTEDSLIYEHPLPLHLIHYAVRTDKYYSIGTAFAIGPKKFVTAAHVMSLGSESQFKEVCLRDKDGNVYAIDKITKYSEQRDFAVFSLKDKTAKEFFQVNAAPRINQKVFAVGNALGEGIVIRDGLYTSSTLEGEEGAWKWIRFSAAASPGNSGGPLLDTDGKVIGIVLQKSPNENLNIALPIAEVISAKENLASAHRVLRYSLDNIRVGKLPTFNKEITLPKSYQELNRELIEGLNLLFYNTIKELFEENRNTIFPNGRGSDIILHSNYFMTLLFPDFIMQGEDGNWYPSRAKETNEAELPNNGRLRYGNVGNTLFLYIQKPDDVSLETFYGDSKLFMDLILKGVSLPRKIEGEQIRIKSLGKSCEAYVFVDSYGRKWLVKSWLIEYSDEKLVTFSLPIPGGCITLIRAGQTGLVNSGHIPDLKILSNFIYPPYHGTLKNWREFLKMKEFLPLAFSGLEISFDYGKALSYRSRRLSFSFTPDLMNITEKSLIDLSFNYFKEGNKTVWDVSTVSVGEDSGGMTYVAVNRKIKPARELSDKFQTEWETIVAQRFPFDRSAYYGDKITSIATVLKHLSSKSSPVLYTALYGQDGKVEQAEMEGKLDKFLRNLTVYEYGQEKDITHNTGNDSYHDESEYFKALWDQISEMHPQTADGYILRGNVYQDKRDTEQAIANYDKAIALNPENAEGYFNRALANQGNGKFELALPDYNKAVELNPRHAATFFNRGNIYRDMGNLVSALADYDKAIEKEPKLVEVYVARGNIYASRDEIDRAIADYNMAIEYNPNYVLAYVNRGNRLSNKGENSKAFADYNKALEIDPMSTEAYNARGFAYSIMGELQSTLSDLNKALEINPLYAVAYNNRGTTYGRKKEMG